MKKFYIFVLITAMLLTVNVCYSHEIETNLVNKVIILDAGHGGKDSGTLAKGTYEKDLNLKLVLLLQKELIKKGATVILTRDGDYDLSKPNASRRKKSDFDNRINLINEAGADLYLSIHMNYLENNKYYGAQVFYTKGNEVLATVMQQSLIKDLKSPLREKKLSNTIYMYKKLKVPGVLIECGFLSNKRELFLLKQESYQQKIVESIVNGLINYY